MGGKLSPAASCIPGIFEAALQCIVKRAATAVVVAHNPGQQGRRRSEDLSEFLATLGMVSAKKNAVASMTSYCTCAFRVSSGDTSTPFSDSEGCCPKPEGSHGARI